MKTDFFKLIDPLSPVLSVYLFGSAAAGIQGANSDVDIAVYLNETISSDTAIELRFQLMDLFEEYFDRPVDVVLLNSASLKMVHQVLKKGELLYARDPAKLRAFALRKRKAYFDFKYYIDKDIEQMRSFYGVEPRG